MKFLPLICIIGNFLQQSGASSPVPLTINPGGAFTVNYQLSTGQATGPVVVQITGDLTGEVEFSGGILSQFRFLGGNVAYSDATSEVTMSTFPVTAKVRIEARNIISSLTSNSSAGSIDPETGVIGNNGHFLQQNRGTIRTRYLVAGTTVQQELRDLATQPDNNPLVGVTTVTSSVLADLGYKTRYQINLSHSRDESRTQPAEVVNGTVNITEVGSFSATGEVTEPGATFVQWAEAEFGQTPATLADRLAGTGQPLVLLYAFEAGDRAWSPPVVFDPPAGTVRIDLPANGLKAPVRLEYSDSLGGGQWVTLTKSNGTPSLFSVGESGPALLNLPAVGAGFVRLSLAD